MLRTLLTLACFGLFVAIVLWAYGGGRRQRFAQAARLPLDEDVDCAADAAPAEGATR